MQLDPCYASLTKRNTGPIGCQASVFAEPIRSIDPVHREFQVREHFLRMPQSCYDCAVRDLAVLFLHLLATVTRLAGPCGARAVVTESVLVKHQLLSLNRS